MHVLEVADLLPRRLPRRGRTAEAGHDLDPRGGQPESSVEALQIPTDIGWTRVRGWNRSNDRHRLATTVDSSVQQ